MPTHFHHAAPQYDTTASLQRSLVHALAEEVAATAPRSGLVLDAGCGTGFFARWCEQYQPDWCVLGVDSAFGMCHQARRHSRVMQADMQALPLADASVDGLFCASSLQWVDDWQTTFTEFHRVLKPSGWLAVSTFINGTLDELKHAFATLDGYSHLLTFRPPEALFDAARGASLAVGSYHVHHHSERVQSAAALMRHLKELGASGKSGSVRKGLMTPRQLTALEDAYRSHSPNLKASWSIATLIARKEPA